MSEDDTSMQPSEPKEGAAGERGAKARRKNRRLRRFLLRHLPLSVAGLFLIGMTAVIGLYLWASSAGFEDLARKRLIAELEDATGGRVSLESFHWKILNLEAEAGGLTLHGSEDVGEEPLLRVARLRLRVSILEFFSPKVILRELEIDRPQFHLIAYPDGSTNEPAPHHPAAAGKGGLGTLFDLRAGVIARHGWSRSRLHPEGTR